MHAATKGCRMCTGLSGSGGAAGPCVAEKTRACSVQHPCAMTVWRLCSDAQTSVVTDKHIRLARCYGQFELPGAGEFPMFVGMLVQPDPISEMARKPTLNPITERVFDAAEVPEQFRDPAPKRAPGRPLSYTPEVADEFCERLEARQADLPRRRDAGLENTPPPPSSLGADGVGSPRCDCVSAPRARALPTNHQIACLTGRSTVVRRVIVSVPLTRPGLRPKADRSPCLTQLPRGEKRERHRGGMVTRNGGADDWK